MTSRKLSLLCVARNEPFGPASADGARVAGLLGALAQRHTVELMSIVTSRESQAVADSELYKALGGRVSFYVEGGRQSSAMRRASRRCQSILERTPPEVLCHLTPEVVRRLRMEASYYDATVFLDNAASVHWKAASQAGCVVIDIHQVAGWARKHANRDPIFGQPMRRMRQEIDATLMVSFEGRSFASAAGLVVTSDEERNRLSALYALDAAVVASAVPIPAEVFRWKGGRSVGWVGNLSYPPNRDGLLKFVRSSWSELAAEGCKLLIAGPNADQEVQGLASESIEVLGYVEDLSAFMSSLDVGLVPLWSGAGMKLKTLGFLAAGVPVVSTSQGLEGLAAVDGVHALEREDPSDMVNAVREILDNRELSVKLSVGGRELAVRDLRWDTVGPQFVSAVEEAVGSYRESS